VVTAAKFRYFGMLLVMRSHFLLGPRQVKAGIDPNVFGWGMHFAMCGTACEYEKLAEPEGGLNWWVCSASQDAGELPT
jgi:hypothetical protein